MATDYDVIVIGGGAGGLSAAGIATHLGAKTALIEREALGGDCTWTGCVPSKTLLKAAKVAHQARHASTYGLPDQAVEIDFGAIMDHVRSVRADVYEDADRPEIFEDMDVDVFKGEAHFEDAHTVAVRREDEAITQRSARFFVIATGASPRVPPIEGLDEVDVLTTESLFELKEQPDHLAILGGGPIGTEMAQAFTRLGTQVTVFETLDRILVKDDAELAATLREKLQDEGVQYELDARVERLEAAGERLRVIADSASGEADALLLATGRAANVDGLNLDAAGVDYDRDGVSVDKRCRTSQRHIFAVGDVTGRYQFTHMSNHMAKVAVTNALLKVPTAIDADHVPWVTYTDPELAHVGARARDLDEGGVSYETYRFPYSKLDRAITEGETTGLIKVHATSFTGTILGASVLGSRAGELITSFGLAMRNGVTLRNIADTIHPYPAWGEGVQRLADQWYVRKQSPTFVRALQTIFRYRGPVIELGPDEII